MMATLLEKAKAVPLGPKSKIILTDEAIEVAIAYLTNEVRMEQLGKVLGKQTGSVQNYVCNVMRAATAQNRVKITTRG